MKKMYKTLRLLLVILLGSNLVSNAQTTTFTTPGGPYAYTVPTGVTGVTVTVQGAKGGLNSDEGTYPDRPGYGGCVTAVLTVTPGQVLNVYVGGKGGDGTPAAGGAGGINGGAAGSNALGAFSGGGGGGSSDIRFAPYTTGDRVVVAGGGGGAAENCGFDQDRGGDGGTTTGETGVALCGTSTGGGGGTPGAPGIGGTCSGCLGSPGSAGIGNTGGAGGNGSAGGGGGGGYFGGGGGQWTGGGGGSDYCNPSPAIATLISDTRGCSTGDGLVAITVSCVGGVIGGPNNVCIGQTIPLTETVGGGTWSSSDITKATIDPVTGVVTGVAAGTATITYTVSLGCTAITTITINSLPAAIAGPTAVCQGSTITLTDATPLGTWSSSDITIATVGSSTGVVTGVNAGAVTITYTVTLTGCYSIATIIVNPIPSPIIGLSQVCNGSSISLSDATVGGTWSSFPAGFVTIAGPGPVTVTGIAAGTTTISYLVGVCAATMSFTVNPLPTAIVCPAAICMDNTTTSATSTPPGGTWTSGTLGVATIDPVTGLITPVGPGLTVLTYTLPTGCQRTKNLTINANPTISGLSQVCAGSTITLGGAPGGGTWSFSPPGIVTVTIGGVVTGVAVGGGVATITYTIPATGCTATHPVTVNPRPAVITTPTTFTVCMGSTLDLDDATFGGTWTSGTLPVATIDGVTGLVTPVSVGTTSIRYTLPVTGCFRAQTVTVNPLPGAIVGPTQVCVGQTITLTDPTSPGGTWTSSTPAVGTVGLGTGVVGGITPGTTVITYTLPTGCTGSITVTVNDVPAAITGTNVICQGQSTTLSETSGGGSWSSSVVGVATVGTGTGIVLGVSGGTTDISYTVSGTGCFAVFPMTVNPTPAAYTGLMQLCEGQTTTLTDPTGAGTWVSSNTGVATIGSSSGLVTAILAGTTDITFTLTSTGCTRVQTFTVNAYPSAITGPSSVCTGNTITLASTPIPPAGTWTSSNPACASVGALTGIVTGVSVVGSPVTISYTLGTGCGVTKLVTVNQSPANITGPVNVCLGQSITLTETTAGGTWSVVAGTGAATIVPAGLTVTVTGTVAGTVTVFYTMPNGCAKSQVVTVTTLGTPITGPGQVCTGSTITLSEVPAGGAWVSGTPAVATIAGVGPTFVNATVTGVSPGTTVITYSLAGCSTTKTITVNQTPASAITPLGSLALCPGGFVDLTAPTGVGYTYQWNNPGAIPGATNSTLLVSAAGTYSVTVSTPFCSSTSSPGTVVTMNAVTASITPGSTTVCASVGVTLTATTTGGVINYQWQLGGVAIPGATNNTYAPVSSGSYTVVVSNATGCIATSAAATVTLIPSPAGVITASGPLTFCDGNNVVLTADAGTGYTYQWHSTTLGAIPGATNISYTATIADNFWCVITNTTVTPACVTTSATVVTVVNPAPVTMITAAGPTVLCTGMSVTLSAPIVPGTTFQWYKDGTVIAGSTNALYVAGATGSYTVKVTITATGCSATSAPMVITIVTTPIIVPLTSTSFCWGGSALLSAAIVPGAGTVNYQWYRGASAILGATGASYNATTGGLYSCQVVIPSSCTTTSVATLVTEFPLPNPLVSYTTTTYTLHTQTFYHNYQWFKNGVAITGGTAANFTVSGNGVYHVKVIDSNGCQSVSTDYILTDYNGSNNVGVQNVVTTGEIKIFPNPAQNMVHVESAVPVHAVISSIDGRTVIDQKNATDIDISMIADGIYTIKLYDANGQMLKTDKLVKMAN
jgi:trimeric autotransporter adhesin